MSLPNEPAAAFAVRGYSVNRESSGFQSRSAGQRERPPSTRSGHAMETGSAGQGLVFLWSGISPLGGFTPGRPRKCS